MCYVIEFRVWQKKYTNNIAQDIFIYRSKLIAHRLSIDAVHSKMSNDIQISQRIRPHFQEPTSKQNKRKTRENKSAKWMKLK